MRGWFPATCPPELDKTEGKKCLGPSGQQAGHKDGTGSAPMCPPALAPGAAPWAGPGRDDRHVWGYNGLACPATQSMSKQCRVASILIPPLPYSSSPTRDQHRSAPRAAGAAFPAARRAAQEPCPCISRLSPSISLTANSGELEGVPLSGTTLWKCHPGDVWRCTRAPAEQGGKSDISKDFFFMASSIGRVLRRAVFQARPSNTPRSLPHLAKGA